MGYQILILRKAQRQLDRIRGEYQDRIIGAVFALSENPRPPGCKKLKGREDWRIRVGDYRVIYDIDDTARRVAILRIAHRRESYH